ncbi:MAG: DUF554 domain-containing protein [Myxococcales bacterium]|nr:DUF554 domain-containing protein [Myxococcales bacterium]
MIAVYINAAAVFFGSLLGLLFKTRIHARMSEVVYTAIGLATLLIGFSMGLATARMLYLVLSLVLGGLVGTWLNIEGGILKLGNVLRGWSVRIPWVARLDAAGEGENGARFARGFLDASVLFCVGAMTILGCLQAGMEGKYDLLLIKSAMDGFVAILLAATMGLGVAFSALVVLLYQGALTLGATWVAPVITDLMLSEIKGVGGVLILMIGFNLLQIKRISTANFIPAILFALAFCVVDPWLQPFVVAP